LALIVLLDSPLLGVLPRGVESNCPLPRHDRRTLEPSGRADRC